MEQIKLSEKGKQELRAIREKVDEDFKEIWDNLDKYLKQCEGNYTHKDVHGFGMSLYVLDRETKERIYLFDKNALYK